MNKIFAITILMILFFPLVVSANGSVTVENPIVADSFETVINNIIDFLFKIAIVLVPLMVVIGGIMFLTSAGNLERVNQSKRILVWSMVGFLIILLSKGILAMLESLLTKE